MPTPGLKLAILTFTLDRVASLNCLPLAASTITMCQPLLASPCRLPPLAAGDDVAGSEALSAWRSEEGMEGQVHTPEREERGSSMRGTGSEGRGGIVEDRKA